jgi:hypothetical protein
MKLRNDHSTGISTTPAGHDDLLYCRMAMLGLDRCAIESDDRETFDRIKRRCSTCGFWEACAVDLKRDSTNPVWEAYCPNSEDLNALTELLVANDLI